MRKLIPLFKPCIDDKELNALKNILKTGWIGLGPKTVEFEKEFAKYIGAKYAVAVNSCTAALHLALEAFDVRKGDEVLVSPLTFVSTAHSILYNKATPVFVDIEPDTLCISPEDIKKKVSNRTKMILPMHYGGHPCNMDEIMEIARKHNLYVIEDAAHACGARYEKRKIGTIGDATCFSFHAVKNLTTGEGGMITMNNPEIVSRIKRMRWMGIDKGTWERTEKGEKEIKEKAIKKSYGWYYEVYELGYKYNMNDIAAAIGLVQLKKLDKMNKKRREIVKKYNKAFEKIEWIETPVEKNYVYSACHNYVIKTPYRDKLYLYLKGKSISSGVHYMPVYLHPYYKKHFPAKTPVVQDVWTKLLTLPLFPELTDSEFNYIVESVVEFKKFI